LYFTKFQFQYGAIKRIEFFCNSCFLSYFNSNMVRLRDQHLQTMHTYYPDFNSNMVRLREKMELKTAIEILFQFQYGAIKREWRLGKREDMIQFQFQYGAIKR